MIYLDTTVVLAQALTERRQPPDGFWAKPFVSSRLLEYEVFKRLHALSADTGRHSDARLLIDRVALVELTPAVLCRALAAFPLPVRTLDGLHLATLHFLRSEGQVVELATYDQRLSAAALALGFAIATV